MHADSVRILVADDDARHRAVLAGVLATRIPCEVLEASDGAQALETALREPRPRVLVLDWMMPKLTGTQVCRLVRKSPWAIQPQIVFYTARTRREELWDCLAAGADDVLTKPCAPDLLVARIGLALRRDHMQSASKPLRDALYGAAREREGELIVRSGSRSGKVLFSDGKLGWVHFDDGQGSVLDALSVEAGLDPEVAQALLEECRRTGTGLASTLASWGIVDGLQLRNVMRTWLRNKIGSLAALEHPEVLFAPGRQRCSPELLFELDELLDPESPASRGVTEGTIEQSPSLIPAAGWAGAFVGGAEQSPFASRVLGQLMAADGIAGAVILDAETGRLLGTAGRDLDPDVAWNLLNTATLVGKSEPVESVVVAAHRHFHCAALWRGEKSYMIYATFRASETTLAGARLSLLALKPVDEAL
jgi:CheY-like chemotaxis protein